jgi:hypothetical protein
MRRVQSAAFALPFVVALLACRAGAAPTWLAPIALSSPTEDQGAASIGLDRAGDAFAVWWAKSDGSYVVRARERAAGRHWTAPQDLSARVDYMYFDGADVAVNSAGDAVAVWAAQRGSHWSVESSTRHAGRNWEPPQVLWSRDEPSPLVSFVDDPRVALDRRGDAVAMWGFGVVDPDPPYSGSTELDVAARSGSSGWSAPTTLTRRPFEDADVGLDATGDATGLWAEQAEDGSTVVRSAGRPSRGSWTDPARVSPAEERSAQDARLAVDGAGNAVAVWTADPGLLVSRRPVRGSWTRRPHILSRLRHSRDFEASLAADAAGDVVVMWQDGELEGRRIVPWIKAAARPRRGAWSKSTKVGRGYVPDVVLDPAGAAVAVWRKNLIVEAARRPAHGAWSRVSIVWPPGVLTEPKVAVDGRGNALVGWMNESVDGRWNEAAALDAAGPVFARLLIPARARTGRRARFSVSPYDIWSRLGTPPRWSFGDGGTATGIRVRHSYRTAGSFRVRVSQSDVHGNRTSVTRLLSVAG